MKKPRYNREQKDRAKILYIDGYSYHEIAKNIGCQAMTVREWSQAENWAKDRDDVYAKSAAMINEKAATKQIAIHDEMIQAYYDMLQKGMEALSKVDVIPTKEAIELADKAIKGIEALSLKRFETEFIIGVVCAIGEEMTDSEQRKRVGIKIKGLLKQYSLM